MQIRLIEEKLSQVEISVKTAAKFKRGDLKGFANGVTYNRDKWNVSLGCGKNNTCFQINVGYGGEGILSYMISSSTDGGPACDDALVRKVLNTVSKAIDNSTAICDGLSPDELWGAVFDPRSSERFKLQEKLLGHFSKALDTLKLK